MNRIALLPTDVVDKIAAGEVVVRPVNAIKELIENSLDAGATEITVSIRRGGLDLIKVQDNGCGISEDDMPIVCARFATSKLREYEDLSCMQTFGFRGEALASISYVSNVTIVSRQSSDVCAHKAKYEDGKMIGSLGRSAGLKGTTVTAENLFYNCPARRRAMKYPQEEAIRILDLIVKYAIENPSVAFAMRRLDAPSSDFRTNGTGDRNETIRALLGMTVSKNLLDANYKDEGDLHFSFRATFSAPIPSHTSTAIQSRQNRYKSFHLFINGRNVDSPRMKQSVDLVFAAKDSTCQFINISLQIDPSCVDVNVHPTKAIVHFLNEDRIIQTIEEHMFKLVNEYCSTGMIEVPVAAKANISASGDFSDTVPSASFDDAEADSTRTSVTKRPADVVTSNPTVKRPRFSDFEATSSRSGPVSRNTTLPLQQQGNNAKNSGNNSSAHTSSNSAQRVRIDASNRRLDEFLSPATKSASSPVCGGAIGSSIVKIASETQMVMLKDQVDSNKDGTSLLAKSQSISRTFQLDSVDALRREICRENDESLMAIFRRHHFVGLYGNGCAVFQVNESAYFIQLNVIIQQFFYQLVIFYFGNMGSYRLQLGENDASTNDDGLNKFECFRIRDLLQLFYELNELPIVDTNEIDHIIERIAALSDLLWDYFSIGVNAVNLPESNNKTDGPGELYLKTVPCVIDGYIPPLESLPELIFDLGNVDCDEEEKCFRGIAEALSKFFTPSMANNEVDEADSELLKASLCRFVLPPLKSKFLPPARLSAYVRKITNIELAFKKFGRC